MINTQFLNCILHIIVLVGFCPSGFLFQWNFVLLGFFVQWFFVPVGFCPSGFLSYTRFASVAQLKNSNDLELIYRNDPKFMDRSVWANSSDPDQTAPFRSIIIIYLYQLYVSFYVQEGNKISLI